MHNFRNTILFLVLVVVIGYVLNFLLVPSSYIRVVLHEVQDENQNYDMIVVGQSHSETDINPYIIEEKTGYSAYNLSRRLVSMTDLAYMVKESNYKNTPKVIVMDLDATYFQGEGYTDYFCDSYIYPHINNPKNKLEYFGRYNLKNDFRVTLCRFTNLKDGLLQLPFTLKSKTGSAYYQYDMSAVKMPNENYEYIGRGFRYGIKRMESEYTPSTWNEDNISEKAENSFNEIVDYCEKEKIQLICVSSPVSKTRLSAEPYDEIHQYFETLTANRNVPYFDFNVKDAYGLEWTDKDFADMDGHMMGEMAERYSNTLGILITNYLKENDNE